MTSQAAVTRTFQVLLIVLSLVHMVLSKSSPGSLYIHPCAKGKGKSVDISPSQANQVLSHLLDVPGELLGASAGNRDVWDWVDHQQGGKKAVQDLFQNEKQRSVILFSDLDAEDAQDVIPSQIRRTHSIVSPPHASSFEALLHLYGDRIYAAVPYRNMQFGGFFTSTAESVETALERTATWLLGGSLAAIGSSDKAITETDLGGEAADKFSQSVKNLVAFFDQDKGHDDLSYELSKYQVLRFDGLDEIKSAYGQKSDHYEKAKQIIRSILEAVIEKTDKAKHQKLAFVVLPKQEDALVPRSVDLLSPFRSSLSLTPFMTTRDVSSTLAKNDTSKAPIESNFIGKCFSSEKDLNKATLNCSSHGKAIQSSKGGKKCYRCKCQQTKGKGGNNIAWAGAACQKQDISKPFVLLLSTTVGLALVILGSVYYLFYEGEQELPSVLAGISIPNK